MSAFLHNVSTYLVIQLLPVWSPSTVTDLVNPSSTLIFPMPEAYYSTLTFWGSYSLGTEKAVEQKIRFNLRTLCQYHRKESTKVITGSKTHSGRRARPVHISRRGAESARAHRILCFLPMLEELFPTVRPKNRGCKPSPLCH